MSVLPVAPGACAAGSEAAGRSAIWVRPEGSKILESGLAAPSGGWSDPWHAGHTPSGLTLPVDSRHKTGTGEVAEWLKAALC